MNPASDGDEIESGSLWEIGSWRCVFTGTSVHLWAEQLIVASLHVHGKRDVERASAQWRRSVEAIMELEKAVRGAKAC